VDYLSHFVEFSQELTQLAGLDALVECVQADFNLPGLTFGRFECCLSVSVVHLLDDEGLRTIASSLVEGGLYYCEEYFLLKDGPLTPEEQALYIKGFNLPKARSFNYFCTYLHSLGLQLVWEEDCAHEWTLHYWSKAEQMLMQGLSEHELPTQALFVDFKPKVMRSFPSLTVAEVYLRFPCTAARINYEGLHSSPTLVTSKRLAFKA
jgi:hypothetical protein